MNPSQFIERTSISPAEAKRLQSAAAKANAIGNLVNELQPQSRINAYNCRARLKQAADDAAATLADCFTAENAAALLDAHTRLQSAELAWHDVEASSQLALAEIDQGICELALEIIRRAKADFEQAAATSRDALAAMPLAAEELRSFDAKVAACADAFSAEFEAVRRAPLGHLQHHGIAVA